MAAISALKNAPSATNAPPAAAWRCIGVLPVTFFKNYLVHQL